MNEVICMVYVTVPDPEAGERLGSQVVEARLAACANILHPVTSIYHWDGQVRRDTEAVLILKTQRALYPQLESLVKANHPYDCPCIVSWDLPEGHGPFLDWVRSGTRPV